MAQARPFASFTLALITSQTRLVIQSLQNNVLLAPILLDRRLLLMATVVDENGDAPLDESGTPVTCAGSVDFDPGTAGTLYLPGSFNDVELLF